MTRARTTQIPDPTPRHDDLVSRGKREPKMHTAVDITATELKTIELYMRRLGIPNAKRMRLFATVDGAPDILLETEAGRLRTRGAGRARGAHMARRVRAALLPLWPKDELPTPRGWRDPDRGGHFSSEPAGRAAAEG